jgi:hypothetical protein
VVGLTQPPAEPNAEQVRRRIEPLVEIGHRLWTDTVGTGEDPERHERLTGISRELDRCWDALGRRRAAPQAPPEPPHLERGSPRPANQPSPEPDINPHAP